MIFRNGKHQIHKSPARVSLVLQNHLWHTTKQSMCRKPGVHSTIPNISIEETLTNMPIIRVVSISGVRTDSAFWVDFTYSNSNCPQQGCTGLRSWLDRRIQEKPFEVCSSWRWLPRLQTLSRLHKALPLLRRKLMEPQACPFQAPRRWGASSPTIYQKKW